MISTYLLSENHSFKSLEVCEVGSLGLCDSFLGPALYLFGRYRSLSRESECLSFAYRFGPLTVHILFLPCGIEFSSLDGSFNVHFDVCERDSSEVDRLSGNLGSVHQSLVLIDDVENRAQL